MRPRTLEEFIGQEHLVGPGKPLRTQIDRDDTGSIIFWGPPGVGKTTLAKVIARLTRAEFIEFSAVLAGIKEIKQVMADADKARQYGTRTIVFIDEIHRFNKAQQDAFLPYVESGAIRLIGATTENPSFEIISALLSRCRVYVLNPLTEEQIVTLLRRALADKERGLGKCNCRPATKPWPELPLTPAATRAAPTTPSRSRPGWQCSSTAAKRALKSLTLSSRTRCRSGCCSTTRRARSTTTLSPPCTNRCATAILMPPCTGWGECWRRVKTRCTWRAAWCAWRWRTSAWPIPRRWRSPSRPATRWTSSACPRATWRWPKQRCTWRWRPSRTRSTRPMERCSRTWSKPWRSLFLCTCATRPPG